MDAIQRSIWFLVCWLLNIYIYTRLFLRFRGLMCNFGRRIEMETCAAREICNDHRYHIDAVINSGWDHIVLTQCSCCAGHTSFSSLHSLDIATNFGLFISAFIYLVILIFPHWSGFVKWNVCIFVPFFTSKVRSLRATSVQFCAINIWRNASMRNARQNVLRIRVKLSRVRPIIFSFVYYYIFSAWISVLCVKSSATQTKQPNEFIHTREIP